ncbi:MAG: glutamine phosphoribosylpyrophosphate amidotransferase [Burkholderiales bacterium]|nr:glutamine phosphoribosylpyrophosphate amidotransferase [Anaerolineae bacterium]
MCGIAGYYDKTGSDRAPVGRIVLGMLDALGCRGPDSAGVALYNGHNTGCMILRVKLGERGHFEEKGWHITEQMRHFTTVQDATTTAEYLRLVVDYHGSPDELEHYIESLDPELEVVSMGQTLEIVKQVGSPQNLDSTYNISTFTGPIGIGHTRLSTESRVDLSHSQPFWSHGRPDLATVHNGHITNYRKKRWRYEQQGVHFYTENDSEIIGVYLAEQMDRGLSLEEAMRESVKDLDGSFSYIAATSDSIGFAKDQFALKPLLVAETDEFVVIATEEIAIRAALQEDVAVREAQAGEIRVWQR